METLLHYSRKPVGPIGSRTQACPTTFTPKPNGFWVSVEDDGPDAWGWRQWCEAEGYGLESLACAHDVVLASDARILRLTSALCIDAFTSQYGHDQERRARGAYSIDWRRVADTYQGIIIAPYQWSRRLEAGSPWYYGWDCASGCIWDASAIASITLRPAEPSPLPEHLQIGRAAA